MCTGRERRRKQVIYILATCQSRVHVSPTGFGKMDCINRSEITSNDYKRIRRWVHWMHILGLFERSIYREEQERILLSFGRLAT